MKNDESFFKNYGSKIRSKNVLGLRAQSGRSVLTRDTVPPGNVDLMPLSFHPYIVRPQSSNRSVIENKLAPMVKKEVTFSQGRNMETKMFTLPNNEIKTSKYSFLNDFTYSYMPLARAQSSRRSSQLSESRINLKFSKQKSDVLPKRVLHLVNNKKSKNTPYRLLTQKETIIAKKYVNVWKSKVQFFKRKKEQYSLLTNTVLQEHLLVAVVKLQATFRGYLTRKHLFYNFANMEMNSKKETKITIFNAASRIQRFWRQKKMIYKRRQLLHDIYITDLRCVAAVKIQRNFRKYRICKKKKELLELLENAVTAFKRKLSELYSNSGEKINGIVLTDLQKKINISHSPSFDMLDLKLGNQFLYGEPYSNIFKCSLIEEEHFQLNVVLKLLTSNFDDKDKMDLDNIMKIGIFDTENYTRLLIRHFFAHCDPYVLLLLRITLGNERYYFSRTTTGSDVFVDVEGKKSLGKYSFLKNVHLNDNTLPSISGDAVSPQLGLNQNSLQFNKDWMIVIKYNNDFYTEALNSISRCFCGIECCVETPKYSSVLRNAIDKINLCNDKMRRLVVFGEDGSSDCSETVDFNDNSVAVGSEFDPKERELENCQNYYRKDKEGKVFSFNGLVETKLIGVLTKEEICKNKSFESVAPVVRMFDFWKKRQVKINDSKEFQFCEHSPIYPFVKKKLSRLPSLCTKMSNASLLVDRIQQEAAVIAWTSIFSHTKYDEYKQRVLTEGIEEKAKRATRVYQRNNCILACYRIENETDWLLTMAANISKVGVIYVPSKQSYEGNEEYANISEEKLEEERESTLEFVYSFICECFPSIEGHLSQLPIFLISQAIKKMIFELVFSQGLPSDTDTYDSADACCMKEGCKGLFVNNFNSLYNYSTYLSEWAHAAEKDGQFISSEIARANVQYYCSEIERFNGQQEIENVLNSTSYPVCLGIHIFQMILRNLNLCRDDIFFHIDANEEILDAEDWNNPIGASPFSFQELLLDTIQVENTLWGSSSKVNNDEHTLTPRSDRTENYDNCRSSAPPLSMLDGIENNEDENLELGDIDYINKMLKAEIENRLQALAEDEPLFSTGELIPTGTCSENATDYKSVFISAFTKKLMSISATISIDQENTTVMVPNPLLFLTQGQRNMFKIPYTPEESLN